jgi:hypothetical protein
LHLRALTSFFIPPPPLNFFGFFLAPPSSISKLSLFFARAYNSFLPGLFCTTSWRISAVLGCNALYSELTARHCGLRMLFVCKIAHYHNLFLRRRFSVLLPFVFNGALVFELKPRTGEAI